MMNLLFLAESFHSLIASTYFKNYKAATVFSKSVSRFYKTPILLLNKASV